MTAFGLRGAEVVDDLLDRDDRALRGEHRLLLHADDALDEHVAVAVGAQRVDDRDVRPDRRHGRQHLAGIGAGDRADVRIDLGEVDALVAAEHGEGQVGRAGLVGVGHRGVASAPRASSGCGQPFSTASRMRCSEPTPGLPPQEKISLSARSPCR